MIDYQSLITQLENVNLSDWPDLQAQLDVVFNSSRYGDLPKWQQIGRAHV